MHGNYPPTTTPNLPATQRHPARDAGTARLDLKHLGLIVSAGTAVGLRFFSDFDLRAVEQRAIGAGLDATPGSLAALVVQTLVAQLHHDWFNLSPVAPFQ